MSSNKFCKRENSTFTFNIWYGVLWRCGHVCRYVVFIKSGTCLSPIPILNGRNRFRSLRFQFKEFGPISIYYYFITYMFHLLILSYENCTIWKIYLDLISIFTLISPLYFIIIYVRANPLAGPANLYQHRIS